MVLPKYARLVLADSPVAYWRLNEPSADFANTVDLVAPAGPTGLHTAIVQDATNLTYAAEPLVPGLADAAPFFDGFQTGDLDTPQVVVPHHADFAPAGAFSVECWCRPQPSTGSIGTPVYKQGTTHVPPGVPWPMGFYVAVVSLGDATFQTVTQFRVWFGIDGVDPAIPFAGSAEAASFLLPYGPVYHVVCRRATTGAMDIMVNGAANTEFVFGNPTTFDLRFDVGVEVEGDLKIGSSTTVPDTRGNVPPNAAVGQVAFYDYFLTDARVRAHYRGIAVTSSWAALL